MKFLAFILLLSSVFLSQGQETILDSGVIYKKGIYLTFEEFKNNNPSVSYSCDIVEIVREYDSLTSELIETLDLTSKRSVTHYKFNLTDFQDEDKKEFRKKLKNAWGFSDGDKVYVRRPYIDLLKSTLIIENSIRQFVELVTIGRYCYFEYVYVAKHRYYGPNIELANYKLLGRTKLLGQSIIDFNTGKQIELTKSTLRDVIKYDDELAKRFELEKKKGKLLKQYIIEYSKRNSNEIKVYNAKKEKERIANSTGINAGILDSLIFQMENESEAVYHTRLLSYKDRKDVIKTELIAWKHPTGKIKVSGIKMRHKKGINEEFFYKVGTWKYYHKNGQLKKVVNYNLVGKKEGEYFEYDTNGAILKELNYKNNVVID